MHDPGVDEILGITRCVRCGQRLEGEIACPVCSGFDDPPPRSNNWIFITACFLTSPLSLPAILTTNRLSTGQKILAFSGCLLWFGIWRFLS